MHRELIFSIKINSQQIKLQCNLIENIYDKSKSLNEKERYRFSLVSFHFNFSKQIYSVTRKL